MDAAAHIELMSTSEEGSTAEVVAPPAAFRHGPCFRRAGLATLGFAGLVLVALAVNQEPKQSSASMAMPDITMLMESSAVRALGRPLTEQEHSTLRKEFNGTIFQTRNLNARGGGGRGRLPSSSRFGEATSVKADHDLEVDYAGGVVRIRRGDTYYVDKAGAVLVGWHGTYSPPCGMDGEPMV